MLVNIALSIIVLIYAQYFFWILRFAFAWRDAENLSLDPINTCVSVVVVARNEAPHIASLIKNIATQQYPTKSLEFILVDDNSTDQTVQVARQCMALYPDIRFRILHNEKDVVSPKKQGVELAVREANFNIVLITDADCVMGDKWIASMLRYFLDPKVQFVFGPVRFADSSRLWNRLLQMEFVSLVASGAATAFIKKPIMCNGANMAFRREAFDQVGGYSTNVTMASGDDVFLMHKIYHHFSPSAVCFANSLDAFVQTYPPSNLQAFIQQRVRWASKSRAYTNGFAKYMAVLVFLASFFLFVFAVLGVFSKVFLWLFFLAFSGKFLIDMIFIRRIAPFFKLHNWHFLIVLLNVLYPLYITVIGIRSLFFASYSWKGRRFTS